MSSLFTRTNAVIPQTPSADHSGKEGYLVDMANGTATISSSASTPADGVILEGNVTTKKDAIGILGALSGTVRLKTSGAIAAGARVQQAADGTVITSTGGGGTVVVGVALEAGASGDLIEVATFTPYPIA